MACKVNIKLYMAAKNTITFTLYTKVDGVKTLRDIDWAQSGRFTVYDPESGTVYVDITDALQVVIDTAESTVVVTVLVADFEDVEWSDGAVFRLSLIGSDSEPVVVATGGVTPDLFV